MPQRRRSVGFAFHDCFIHGSFFMSFLMSRKILSHFNSVISKIKCLLSSFYPRKNWKECFLHYSHIIIWAYICLTEHQLCSIIVQPYSPDQQLSCFIVRRIFHIQFLITVSRPAHDHFQVIQQRWTQNKIKVASPPSRWPNLIFCWCWLVE